MYGGGGGVKRTYTRTGSIAFKQSKTPDHFEESSAGAQHPFLTGRDRFAISVGVEKIVFFIHIYTADVILFSLTTARNILKKMCFKMNKTFNAAQEVVRPNEDGHRTISYRKRQRPKESEV